MLALIMVLHVSLSLTQCSTSAGVHFSIQLLMLSSCLSNYEDIMVPQGQEPFTSRTFSLRKLDFIRFSQALSVLGVLQTLPENMLKDRLPTATFPSDHLSLKAVFSLSPNTGYVCGSHQ